MQNNVKQKEVVLIRKRLINHLDKNNFIVDNQHGFRSERSCETPLLESIHDWSGSLENKSSVHIIFLDISRAFDVVFYPHLLTKLQTLGLSYKMYLWIAAFLSNRQQCVKLGNEYSPMVNVSYRVPQETVISTILFIIYINDIADN